MRAPWHHDDRPGLRRGPRGRGRLRPAAPRQGAARLRGRGRRARAAHGLAGLTDDSRRGPMDAEDAKVTIPTLQRMKRDGRKIVGVVAWDYQIARIVDRAGVDLVSVGDTVGVNLWGQSNP
ncbi:MAG TPA: 3-methyl-2-oxobutanoate hydroxymethyltransferase, partial [Actinomycetes bacterium]|nr:3-methyl-2-oxobutanoate hydroxymethyltransferase [Actinomycetes bacterium]